MTKHIFSNLIIHKNVNEINFTEIVPKTSQLCSIKNNSRKIRFPIVQDTKFTLYSLLSHRQMVNSVYLIIYTI